MPLYFDASQMPSASPEYVAWVDVMGTQAAMSRSISGVANFIFKLHTAALQAPTQNIQLYPVMDGFYAATANQRDMLKFLKNVFEAVADEFNNTAEPWHRFIIRGALAFGPVIHGGTVPQMASNILAQNKSYRDSILLGLPIVQAHLGENKAPPFGIFIHESARSFASAGQPPLHFAWWEWSKTSSQVWIDLKQNLSTHLTWCEQHAMPLEYSGERIKIHAEMAKQYFQ